MDKGLITDSVLCHLNNPSQWFLIAYNHGFVKPLTDKWSYLVAMCSLQGVASISRATATYGITYILAMVHLQQFTCNSLLKIAIFITFRNSWIRP